MYRFQALAVVILLFFAGVAIAEPRSYSETADANAEVETALATAKQTNRLVLLIFGSDWCVDSRALDAAMKSSKNAELISNEFVLVKIDVGKFNRNLSVVNQYGNPIKSGIPAAVVLSPGKQLLYSSRNGELANARLMSESNVYDFFSNIVSSHKASR